MLDDHINPRLFFDSPGHLLPFVEGKKITVWKNCRGSAEKQYRLTKRKQCESVCTKRRL